VPKSSTQGGFFCFRRANGAKEGDLLGKSPLNYTGNKACIALYLLDIMPPHIGYIEAFCGSAELFLWKDPCPREILNDYNGDLMNFWRVVRSDRLALLIGKIFLSVNGEEAFRENRELLRDRPNILDDCSEIAEHLKTATDEEVRVAAAFFETQFYSFSSTGTSWRDTAPSNAATASGRNPATTPTAI
jgi:site-specific DNA-adenine methylase